MRFALVIAALACCVAALAGQAAAVHGLILDEGGEPLPGVTVSIVNSDQPSTAVVGITDQEGRYTLAAAPGRYRVSAELAGFDPIAKALVVGTDDVTLDLQLTLASFQEAVTVRADVPASLLALPQPNAPATISRPVIDSAMLRNSRYEDVLTLMPNVVKGPDNGISIAGAPPTTGALIVDGVNETDPVTGLPGVVVPLDAVNSVDVHAGGYQADVGGATGGVTTIQTRPGADQMHVSVDSIFPRLLFENGSLNGVEYWEPNVGVSGPIIKGRLFFDQALSYRRDRNPFVTLEGPERNLYNQPLSWSQLDANVSSTQHVRVSAGVTAQHTDRAHITAFTPGSSAPFLADDGWSVAALDRWLVKGGAAVELKASALTTTSDVTPYGTSPYLIGHDLATGSYFDRQSRDARRLESGASLTFVPLPQHVTKVGASVNDTTLRERDDAAPARLLRSDGSISTRITFSAPTDESANRSEIAWFAQDTWNVAHWLVLDGGVRYDRLNAIGDSALSPRLAWTLKRNDQFSVSGSAGVFTDKLLLGALLFPSSASRLVQTFDDNGVVEGPGTEYVNGLDGRLRLPRANRWDLGVDRTFVQQWHLHVRYQERYGRDELVIDPVTRAIAPVGVAEPADAALLLSSSGRSTARSLETTVGYQGTGGEVYVSYVRASARGDLNTFDEIDGLFRDPLVQPNQIGALPSAVPNRALIWGLLHLPRQVTVAPFIELRSGFPYSRIDDQWLFVGARNSARAPTFGSVDLSVTRVIDLPRRLPHARVGLKLYNVASMNTEREIQRDVDALTYGERYDPITRDFAFVCTFLLHHQ